MQQQPQAGVLVSGPGTGTSDSVPADLSDGELIIPADDVRRFGAAHIMKLVKEAGTALPEPTLKDGVQQAATGGLIENPYGAPTNDVARVGNSYSGGNVGGNITVNGATPGGTVSTIPAPVLASAPPVPAPLVSAPATAPTAGTPPAPIAPAAAPQATVGGPGVIANTPGQQVRSVFAPPVAPRPLAPPAPQTPRAGVTAPLSALARPEEGYPVRTPGYAQGGLVDEDELRRAAAGPQSLGQIVRNAFGGRNAPTPQPSLAAPGAPDISAGVTGNPALMVANDPGVRPAPAGPQPLASQAQVRSVDNTPVNAAAIAAAPTAPVTAPASSVADGGPLSTRGNVSSLGGWSAPAADRVAQLNRDAEAQRSLSARAIESAQQGVGGPTPGMGIIGPVDYANRNADFNDSAQLRTLAARGAPPGRNGAQVFAQQMQTAALPLIQRAQQREVDTQQAGAVQRSQIQEQGLAARARMTDARQQEANSIDRAKLGIDAIRATNTGVPTGYRVRADGAGLEPTPGGPADPNTPKGKNTLNDTQAKALQFGSRMLVSGQTLDRLAAAGTNQPGLIKRAADTVGLGTVANFTQSPEQQQVEQAQRDFVNATLRRESGAAISESEFANARQQYFPQPGDSPEVIAQKRQNRELATQGFLAEVPDQQNRLGQVLNAAGQANAAPALPAGMSRQVGTSGGKPVYEDAQGRRFIGG